MKLTAWREGVIRAADVFKTHELAAERLREKAKTITPGRGHAKQMKKAQDEKLKADRALNDLIRAALASTDADTHDEG